MPDSPATNHLDANNLCDECGQRHVAERVGFGTRYVHPTCSGHVKYDRASYVKGQDRAELPQPRPCGSLRPKDADWTWKCSSHGGAARQVKAKREQRQMERKVAMQLRDALRAAYGDKIPDMPPADAMLKAVSWTSAEVQVAREQLAETDQASNEHGPLWNRYRQLLRELVQFAAAARAAGCDEARVRLAESQGKLLADVIRGILGDLNLTSEQEAMVGVVVPRHLRSVAS